MVGLVLSGILLGVLILSLWVRHKNIQQLTTQNHRVRQRPVLLPYQKQHDPEEDELFPMSDYVLYKENNII